MKKFKIYLKKLFKIITRPDMAFLPGNLAFFLVLSIFPILTLIGVIASGFNLNVNSLTNLITDTFPNNISDMLNPFIQGKGFDMNVGIFMIIGFFLASNGADALILASNNIYGFKNSDYIKRKIKSMFLIIIIILLIVFMLGFIGFGNFLLNLLLPKIFDAKLVKIITSIFLIFKWPFALFVIYFNIKLIYTIAPDSKIMSKDTTKGAIFTTLALILVIQIYSFWVTHFSHYDIFYGSLSNIVILMLLTYIISYILVIGIAINTKNHEYNDKNNT